MRLIAVHYIALARRSLEIVLWFLTKQTHPARNTHADLNRLMVVQWDGGALLEFNLAHHGLIVIGQSLSYDTRQHFNRLGRIEAFLLHLLLLFDGWVRDTNKVRLSYSQHLGRPNEPPLAVVPNSAHAGLAFPFLMSQFAQHGDVITLHFLSNQARIMALHASRQFIGSLTLLFLLLIVGHATGPMAAWGQALDLKDRPVADIRVLGLEQVKPQLVYNQIRTQKGGPYDVRAVKQDIVRITHLNRFAKVDARVEQQQDGSIILTYQVVELPLLSDVQVVGNKRLPDQQLLARVRVRTGDPAHNFLIERGRHQIVHAYEEEGYFDTTVTVDQQLLGESRIVMYRVVEGVRQRIRAIYFEGNHAFSDKQLQAQIQSKTHTFLFRRGEFSKQRTLVDRDLLRDFYHQRGFLEAEATRDFQVSPQGQDVILTFTVHEGPQYLVDSIQITRNSLFSDAAILEAIPLRKGDVYSVNHTNASEQAIKNLYGQMGYIGTTVRIDPVFLESPASHVKVQVSIQEGKPYWIGEVTIKGNHLTQDRVVKRLLHGILPGRRFEGPQLTKTRKSLEQGSSLFDQGGSITLLGDPNDTHRDVLIEVREKNTGPLEMSRPGPGMIEKNCHPPVGIAVLRSTKRAVFQSLGELVEMMGGKLLRKDVLLL